MIKIENVEVMGWEAAIRGMRNPKNSWAKSDSFNTFIVDERTQEEKPFEHFIGPADLFLASSLADAGPVHGKFLRMITVYLDITAPLYWWKEFDTYKVGTVANSCSTMHKIHAEELTLDDFSHEHLDKASTAMLDVLVTTMNNYRVMYFETREKKYWWQMIQLLPTSYNQRRTVMLNYEVLRNMYEYRKEHKLDEWREFCAWVETLPYSGLITGKELSTE